MAWRHSLEDFMETLPLIDDRGDLQRHDEREAAPVDLRLSEVSNGGLAAREQVYRRNDRISDTEERCGHPSLCPDPLCSEYFATPLLSFTLLPRTLEPICYSSGSILAIFPA